MTRAKESPALRIYLLGNPELRRGEAPVRLETAKTLALLAYLAMRPGTHRRTVLAGMLWGTQDEARAARNLRRALWNLRRALSPDAPEECPFLIVTRQLAEQIQDQHLVMLCLSNLGGALAATGELEEAEHSLQRALSLPEAEGWFLLTETYRYLAQVRIGQGKLEEASEIAQRALALAQETGAQEYTGAAWRVLGEIAARMGRPIPIQGQVYDADACFAEGVRVFTKMGLERERERTLRTWERWKKHPIRPNRRRTAPVG